MRAGNRGLSTRSATLVRRGLAQSAILSPTPGDIWTNFIGMELVYIPPGEFMMGSENGEEDERPVHKVTIKEGFWMGKTPVTQGQWKTLMETFIEQSTPMNNGLQQTYQMTMWLPREQRIALLMHAVKQHQYNLLPKRLEQAEVNAGYQDQRDTVNKPQSFYGEGDDYPMCFVSWKDTQDFIHRLNDKNDGFQYSLPSEAQWEYAARAGTTGDLYGPLDEIAWYNNNSGPTDMDFDSIDEEDEQSWDRYYKYQTTHPVGLKLPNNFGLYDMIGNVEEWCEDFCSNNYYIGMPTDGSANISIGDSRFRVLRGGAYSVIATASRSASRCGLISTLRQSNFGFRVVALPR